MASKTENLSRPAIKVFVATSVMLTFISFWRAAAIVLVRSGLVGLLRRRRCREGHRQERSLVRSGGHAVQLCGAGHLHRVQRHVRARRRLSRGQAGDGRHPGQALRFGPAVRLHSDRTDQRRGRRASTSPDFLPTRSTTSATTSPFPTIPSRPSLPSWSRSISGGRTSQGIHESSERALQIMKITTVMVVMLIVWCLITLFKHRRASCRRCRLPPPCITTRSRWAGCWVPGRHGFR